MHDGLVGFFVQSTGGGVPDVQLPAAHVDPDPFPPDGVVGIDALVGCVAAVVLLGGVPAEAVALVRLPFAPLVIGNPKPISSICIFLLDCGLNLFLIFLLPFLEFWTLPYLFCHWHFCSRISLIVELDNPSLTVRLLISLTSRISFASCVMILLVFAICDSYPFCELTSLVISDSYD